MPFDKVRIRFRKDGDLRLVSHHDLMRAFERMLRRSGLPFRSSEGFHPQPRMIFAQSLPLGVSGLHEVVEIEWLEPIEPSEALARLTAQAPPGLSFLSAKRIELRQSAKPRRALYRDAGCSASVDELRRRLRRYQFVAGIVGRRERPKPRQVNIRPYVNDVRIESGLLQIDLWITQEGGGSAHDELVRAARFESVTGQWRCRHPSCCAVLEIEDEDRYCLRTQRSRPVLPGRDDHCPHSERPPRPNRPHLLSPALVSSQSHWGGFPQRIDRGMKH